MVRRSAQSRMHHALQLLLILGGVVGAGLVGSLALCSERPARLLMRLRNALLFRGRARLQTILET